MIDAIPEAASYHCTGYRDRYRKIAFNMFTPISTAPTFVTPEEHAQITSSTPSSFSDIPPALRYQDNEVELIIEPQLELYGSSDRLKGSIWVTEE
jgi:nucleotide-sensitive chloride channel 1A